MGAEQPRDRKERDEFLVHHQGPDDIHACRTWMDALELANNLNEEYERWARARTREFGAVAVRSWAVPYRLSDYIAETGHKITLGEVEHD